MGKVLFHKTGGYYIAYSLPGSRKRIKEYFGLGPAAQRQAGIRLAEIALMRAKGQVPRNASGVFLDQLAQLYLHDAKMRGVGEQFRTEFAALLNDAILPVLCKRPVDQLEYQDILKMVEPGGPWADKSTPTVNRYMGYLRSVFKFGVKKKITGASPLDDWKQTPERKKEMHLTLDGLRRIIAAADPHLSWALEVEANLGTRPGPSELFSIRWADVDFEGLLVHVRGTKTEGASRIVPITPDFRARLLIMRQEAKSAYLIEYKGRPVKQVYRSLKTAIKRAGITYPVTPYDVRHLFASVLLQGGADLAAVSALLGHSSIATTQERYYHLMAGEKARAVALMPQVAAPKAGKLVKIK
ncbi:Site-specific recombinase XerD [Humidesulfovibrio mexicanus]|uniref:Site-specific recombinase XerD n=1 Tax=Humidesulfovibrio mexicanus TaxID=147047 RepID=A0A239AU04_9BACT|nr:site-specific integrase [Humidesulfovibrio mexicanus]SNR98802.1 Site-specific recombinase XerD [Humidesulfovibrio mexicanus]